MKLVGRLALFAVFGVASSASAIVISGGPTTAPPGGGSCSVTSGTAPDLTGGVTITCSSLNVGFYRHLYYGINNAPGTVAGWSNKLIGVFRLRKRNRGCYVEHEIATACSHVPPGV